MTRGSSVPGGDHRVPGGPAFDGSDSAEQLRTLLDYAPDGIVLFDLELGRFIDANRVAVSLFGLSREELLQVGVAEVSPPLQSDGRESALAAREYLDQAVAGQTPVFRWLHRDAGGDDVPCEVHLVRLPATGRIIVRGSIRDIRERELAQRALRASERRYRRLFDNDLSGIVIFDTVRDSRGAPVDWVFREINAMVEEITGRKRTELVGRRMTEVFAGIQHRPGFAACRRVALTGTSERLEVLLQTLDTHVEVFFYRPSRDQLATVIRDISARVRATEELRDANHRLERALSELRAAQEQVLKQERLRALGQLTAGVAHDLNNALSPVLGYADLLLLEGGLSPQVQAKLKVILTGAEDAAAVVRRLRLFYRSDAQAKPEDTIDLRALLGELPALTRPRWFDAADRRGIAIAMRVELEPVPPVRGSPAELRQLFTNLVFNAVDALPCGGVVTLGTGTVGDEVFAEVSDDGVGMSDEQRVRCIEPFFTTKQQGSGLGLSVCGAVAARHGGRLEIHSVPGQGSRIRLVLPAVDPSEQVEDAASPAPIALPQAAVLLIDDDPRSRETLHTMLSSLGQRVSVAASGAEGLRELGRRAYDLVITDWGMPSMNGARVLREVRRRLPGTPVVICSGWSEMRVRSEFAPDLPEAVLEKPATLSRLREVLVSVLSVTP